MAICGAMLVSAASVSAAELQSNNGGISLDSLMRKEASGKFVVDDSKTNEGNFSTLSTVTGDKAGGGKFTVTWGADRHYSTYEHAKKTHKASASNSHATESTNWKSKGITASTWIKSTLYGNKANWDVK